MTINDIEQTNESQITFVDAKTKQTPITLEKDKSKFAMTDRAKLMIGACIACTLMLILIIVLSVTLTAKKRAKDLDLTIIVEQNNNEQ